MTGLADEVERPVFHLHESGMPDSVAVNIDTATRIEQARVRSLKLAVDAQQPGRGMQWTFDAASPRAVAQVQSSHVAVCSNADLLKTLPAGWHTDATSFQGRNFVYFPEAGVVLFRERQGTQYRWVPLAYRGVPDEVRSAQALTIGAGPALRPTIQGHLVVSKFGVVYAARELQGGRVVWEQLSSPWPLWFDASRMPSVPGLSAEIAAPSSVPALAHLEATTRLAKLMGGMVAGSPSLAPGTQELLTAVAELDNRVTDWIAHVLKTPSDVRPLALGSRMTRLVSMLQVTAAAARNHPELTSDAGSQQLLAQLAERVRARSSRRARTRSGCSTRSSRGERPWGSASRSERRSTPAHSQQLPPSA